MVIAYEDDQNRIAIHVDPGRSGIWQQEPYYTDIKNWAIAAGQNEGQVIVWQGSNVIAVLPDREKSLGHIRADQLIVTSEKMTRQGKVWDVFIVDAGDPIVNKLKKRI